MKLQDLLKDTLTEEEFLFHRKDKESFVRDKYDTNVPDDAFFMNDGYCDFDSNGMPLSIDLELPDKFVK